MAKGISYKECENIITNMFGCFTRPVEPDVIDYAIKLSLNLIRLTIDNKKRCKKKKYKKKKE